MKEQDYLKEKYGENIYEILEKYRKGTIDIKAVEILEDKMSELFKEICETQYALDSIKGENHTVNLSIEAT